MKSKSTDIPYHIQLGEIYGTQFAKDWKENPSWFPKGKDSLPELARRIAAVTLNPFTTDQRIECGKAAYETCKRLLKEEYMPSDEQ